MDTKKIIDQILDLQSWSSRFPVLRAERLAPLANPRHDPIPKKGGIYQVFMEGAPIPAYIGESKDIRRRVNELRGVDEDLMPFTDPHTAAPCLWAWRQMSPYRPYTVSFMTLECNAYFRKGFEALMIAYTRWKRKHELKEGEWSQFISPLANFHKMPLHWISSSSRKQGFRGGKVRFVTENHTPHLVPVGELDDPRDPLEDPLWGGHTWSPWYSTKDRLRIDEHREGLYRLRRNGEQVLLFIGHGDLAAAHKKAQATGEDLVFSSVAGSWNFHEQLELVTDAIGIYLYKTGNLPLAQYGGEEDEEQGNVLQGFTKPLTLFFLQVRSTFTQRALPHPLMEMIA